MTTSTPDPSRRIVLCVFGTRPEGIKMAPVVRALDKKQTGLKPVVCVTGQHQEMLEPVLDFFGLQPQYRLEVMRQNQTPSEVAARILERLPPVLAAVKPAAVLLQGDTTTTAAAALASFYAGIPVGHVEAGLRTHRKDSPFPEEINRQITTRIADWHFAPTQWARDNLLHEGVADESILVTGNPVIDALHWAMTVLDDEHEHLPVSSGNRRMILVTAHRRENFGRPFKEVCSALRDLVERNSDVEIVYPMHLNPNVQAPARAILENCEKVRLLPPATYPQLVSLLRRCFLVLTDSGGIQEEAPSLSKPVLVMRNTTERPEGVKAGTARLVGTSRRRIVEETERLLRDADAYAQMARAHSPYGDGHAAERIADFLARALSPRGMPPREERGRPARESRHTSNLVRNSEPRF
jgi:UDP-N-acetylglucosamine 2-epimerase (non-hydrolysing)